MKNDANTNHYAVNIAGNNGIFAGQFVRAFDFVCQIQLFQRPRSFDGCSFTYRFGYGGDALFFAVIAKNVMRFMEVKIFAGFSEF
jgi:hypothetical protein